MEVKRDPQDPPYNSDSERILMEEIRGMLHNPHHDHSRRRTYCGGLSYHRVAAKRRLNDLVAIPWERLHNSVNGENNNPKFPCRFTKETLEKNPLGSIKLVRPNTCNVKNKYLSASELLDLPLGCPTLQDASHIGSIIFEKLLYYGR